MNSFGFALPLDAALVAGSFGFVALCCVALVLEEREAFGLKWGWLVAFSLGRVAGDLLGLVGMTLEVGPWTRPIRESLLAVALLCLVEFARSGQEARGHRAPGPWIHPLLLGVVALAGAWGWVAVDLISRAVLGTAGGLWSCRVLWGLEGRGAGWLRVAGVGMLAMVAALIASGLGAIYLGADLVHDVGGGVLMSAPVKGAQAVAVLALAGAAWAALVESGEAAGAGLSAWRAFLRSPWPLAGIAFSLGGGWFLAGYAGSVADRVLRRELVERTSGLAAAIEPEQVVLLRGEFGDERKGEYRHLLRRLTAMTEAQPDIHGTHLLGLKRGRAVFLVSAQARRLRRRDHPAPRPGSPWRPSGDVLARAFQEGEPGIEGPVSDARGSWLTPLVPIREDRDGRVVALLAQDFDAFRWERELVRSRVPFLMAAFFLACAISGGLAYRMQRARSARRLASSETRYSQLFEQMLNGFALHELVRDGRGEPWDFRYLEINPAFERLTGLSREMVVGRTIREAVPGVEPHWMDAYLRVVATGETERIEHFAASLGRWFRVTAYRPAPDQLVTVFSDVTERKRLEADLRANLERFSTAVEQAQGVVYVRRFDPDHFEFVGEGVKGLLGCAPAEFTPEFWLATILYAEHMGEIRDLDPSDAERQFREGRIGRWLAEQVVRTPHRGLRRFLDAATPLRDEHGRVVGSVGMLQDITALRQAEEERLRTQRLLRGIAEASRALLAEPDLGRAIGQALARLGAAAEAHRAYWFERHADPATGEPCVSQRSEWCAEGIVSHANDPALRNMPVHGPVFRRWEAVLARRKTIQGLVRDAPPAERAVLQAQGVVSIIGIPILLGEAGYSGFIGFDECRREREWSAAEIDLLSAAAATLGAAIERHRAQESTRDAIRRFEAIFETNPMVAIQGFSTDGTVRHWNHASEALYGYPAGEAVGQGLQELILPAEAVAPFEEAVRAMAARPAPVDGVEWKVLARDGRERLVYAAMFPLLREGRVEEIFCMEVDITERRHLEDQLRHAQKMEAVGRLAGGVAHDFNNLLVVIGGYADLLLSGAPRDGADRAKLEGIQHASQRAAALTRQLLLFSRKQTPQVTRFEIGRLTEESGEMLRRILGENVRVEIHRADHGTLVRGDPNHFNQVLVNLAVNARDAMPRGGEFTVAISRKAVASGKEPPFPGVPTGDYVEVRVADTGCGMSPEVQAHLFEPFFTTKEPGKGTGLGLSIVYGIVRQSGGHILVESREGKGAVFTILFPVAGAAGTEAARASAGLPSVGGTERILVVEDNEPVRGFILEALRSAGYAVAGAASAEEALDRMAEEGARIQLVLTDVVMPGMGGVELARRLRKGRSRLHVVLMSGFSDDDAALRAAGDLGCVFIRKPFEVADLLRLLRRLLDGSGAGRG
jgi:PAS domain S-box-containing protein